MLTVMCLFYRATTNNKVKETVALELSFVNSNLQLLKEELEELNSNMEVYQTDRYTAPTHTCLMHSQVFENCEIPSIL